MRNYLFFIGLGLSFFFTSCEKKDKPITLPPRGNGSLMQVDMGEKYEFQYFINLEEQKIVHISRMDNWDLAFQSDDAAHGIFLNGGKGMAAYATSKTNFAAVDYSDTANAAKRWKIDESCGLVDSSAFGEWKLSNQVYLVRLSQAGNQIRKIKITFENAYQYIIEVGDITSSAPASITILKNKNQNYTYFSFSLLNTVDNVEPDKSTWDIQSTLFSTTFYDQNPPLPYIVNGFLINTPLVVAYKDSITGYGNINKSFATSLTYSSLRDVIGFDWKKYNIDNNIYSVDPRYTYIIKTRNKAYFKLRFLDFYSSTGIKGSPKFEFQPL